MFELMNKLILLDGPYGIGKTTVARSICNTSNGRNICLDPDEYYNDDAGTLFWYGWPIPNNSCIKNIIRREVKKQIHDKNVIIPLTLNSQLYLNDWTNLFRDIADVKHVILYANKETLLKRISNNADRYDKEHALEFLDENMTYYQRHIEGAYKLNTSSKTPDEIAKIILQLL